MLPVIIIAGIACLGMVACTLIKPYVTVKGVEIGLYYIPPLIAAVVILAVGLLPLSTTWEGLTADTAVNPLKIITLFIAMTILSIFLDEMGFFRYLANAVLRRSGKSQMRLFCTFFLVITVLTVFTSNDVSVLTFTPFICHFSKRAKIDPTPYLMSQFVCENTASIVFVIGNPTNIYLAASQNIGFFEYFTVMALPALLATGVAFCILLLLFRKKLKAPISTEAETVVIKDKFLLGFGLAILGACIIMLSISEYVALEMWLISLGAAVLLTAGVLIYYLSKKRKPAELGRTFKRAPYEIIPFVFSMFILVLALDYTGATAKFAEFLSGGASIWTYGVTSALTANFINNIPMSVLFSSIVSYAPQAAQSAGIYAAIIGSNIGAYFTPLGALAGIMWLRILKEHEVKFSFLKFIRLGVVVAVPALAAALGGLMLSSMIFGF